MIYSIYGIVCPMSGKIVYVGQTSGNLQKRLKGHKTAPAGKKMKTWMSVVRENNLLESVSIVLLAEGILKNEILEQERNYIQKHHAQFPLFNGNKTGEKTLWDRTSKFKLNKGKVKKILDLSPECISKLNAIADKTGATFKYVAQNIIEQAAKRIKAAK